MTNRRFRSQFEPLEQRALLSHLGSKAMLELVRNSKNQSASIVGSIQGTETSTTDGYALAGTGTVQPLGNVSVSGFLGLGGPHGSTGAVNGKGSMTFSNGQSSLVLSMMSHGYFRVGQYDEEIRVTVQAIGATGSHVGVGEKGTINLVNAIFATAGRGHDFRPVPFTAQINLKPAK
jgi:hypothetical protein